MKIKFKVGQGRAVFEYKKDNASLQEAVDILKNENVISISVVKQTSAQFLKSQRALNE